MTRMSPDAIAAELAKPIARDLLTSATPARLAYTGLDGAPRVVPVAFWWDGTSFLVSTVPGSAKTRALAADPRVAITIDTAGLPPRALLVRGTATLETVDGVPDSYVAASRKLVPADAFAEWEADVRELYSSMTAMTITPHWVKLLDFETTLPKSVEERIRATQG